jgi:hypothetical protein
MRNRLTSRLLFDKDDKVFVEIDVVVDEGVRKFDIRR